MDIKEIEQNIDIAVNLLKALSNESRLMVICALYQGKKNVGELAQTLGISQSSVSQHLSRLKQDGLVVCKRRGQEMYYSLHESATEPVLRLLYDIYNPEKKDDGIEETINPLVARLDRKKKKK